MADVSLTFAGNATDAERAIAGLEKKYLALEEKIKRSNKTAKDGISQVQSAVGGWAGGLTGVLAAYVSIGSAIGSAVSAQHKLLADVETAALKYDKLFRGFRIQTGLTDPASEKKLKDVAVKYAMPVERATEAGKFLFGGGMSTQEATGKGLEAFLETVVATDSSENMQLLADATTGYLASQGRKIDAAGVREVGSRLFSLYKENKIQLSDFPALAGEGATFKGKLSMEEQFAAFTALRNVEGAPDAAVDLRRVVTNMSTAGAFKEKTEWLGQMGLKPEDIDLVGESFPEALKKLKSGMDTLPKEQQAIAAVKLFEERGQVGALHLMNSLDQLDTFAQQQRNMKGFEEAVGIGTSGKAASEQRLTTEQEFQRKQQDTGFAQKLKAARLVAEKYEGASWYNDVRDRIAMTSALFMGEDQAIAGSYNDVMNRPGAAPPIWNEIKALHEQTLKNSEAQTSLLKEQNQQNAPKVNRNAQQ